MSSPLSSFAYVSCGLEILCVRGGELWKLEVNQYQVSSSITSGSLRGIWVVVIRLGWPTSFLSLPPRAGITCMHQHTKLGTWLLRVKCRSLCFLYWLSLSPRSDYGFYQPKSQSSAMSWSVPSTFSFCKL